MFILCIERMVLMKMVRVLITGANRGLGFEFTKQYLTLGNEVISTYRENNIISELRLKKAVNVGNIREIIDRLNEQDEKPIIDDLDSVRILEYWKLRQKTRKTVMNTIIEALNK